MRVVLLDKDHVHDGRRIGMHRYRIFGEIGVLESGVSSRPIEPKSLSTSRLQRVVYYLPDEVVPSPSPIRSSRSAKSNNSCWICAIGVCRASCLIFSAIARLSSPLPSRSLLIGVSSTESDSRRRRGASVSLSIGTPES